MPLFVMKINDRLVKNDLHRNAGCYIDEDNKKCTNHHFDGYSVTEILRMYPKKVQFVRIMSNKFDHRNLQKQMQEL